MSLQETTIVIQAILSHFFARDAYYECRMCAFSTPSQATTPHTLYGRQDTESQYESEQ